MCVLLIFLFCLEIKKSINKDLMLSVFRNTWDRLHLMRCAGGSQTSALLALTGAGKHPGLSEATYSMLLLFVMVVTFRHTNLRPAK